MAIASASFIITLSSQHTTLCSTPRLRHDQLRGLLHRLQLDVVFWASWTDWAVAFGSRWTETAGASTTEGPFPSRAPEPFAFARSTFQYSLPSLLPEALVLAIFNLQLRVVCCANHCLHLHPILLLIFPTLSTHLLYLCRITRSSPDSDPPVALHSLRSFLH